MHSPFKLLLLAAGTFLLAACSSAPKTEPKSEVSPPTAEKPASTADQTYKVRFVTNKGTIVVEVHRGWAPLGAKRFEELVNDKFFDGARFFRVIPNFVAQFGLASNPAMTKKWDKPLDDDPVTQTNRVGSLAFATMGKNTRTSQIFINLRSNQSLDSKGFAPFAQIVEGMDVVQSFYGVYGEAPDQEAITKRGNSYLAQKFPKLDYIKTARIM